MSLSNVKVSHVFQARNMKSDPQQKIFAMTNEYPNNPASPFYGPKPITPLAQLVIHRINPKPGESTICYGNETDEEQFDPFEGDSTGSSNKAPNTGEIPMEVKKMIMMSGLSEMEKNKLLMDGLTVEEKKKIVMMTDKLTDMEKTKITMVLDNLQQPSGGNMEMLKKAVMMSSLSQMEQEKLFMEGATLMDQEKIIRMSTIPTAEKEKLLMVLHGGQQQAGENEAGSMMELKQAVMMSSLTESQQNTLLMGDLNDMEREKLIMMSDITEMEKSKLLMLIRQVADERENTGMHKKNLLYIQYMGLKITVLLC